jgi:hypothetical protein
LKEKPKPVHAYEKKERKKFIKNIKHHIDKKFYGKGNTDVARYVKGNTDVARYGKGNTDVARSPIKNSSHQTIK